MRLGELFVELTTKGNLGVPLDKARASAQRFGDGLQKLFSRAGDTITKVGTRLGLAGPLERARAGLRRFGSGLHDALDKPNEDLQELGRRVDKVGGRVVLAFAGMSAAVAGFSAVASPAVFDTLTKSLQLLSLEIGSAFLPRVLQAAGKIQDWADAIRAMDAQQKRSIADWVLIGAGALAAGVAVVKFAGFVFTAYENAQNLYKIFNALPKGTLPITAAVAALTAATVLANREWEKLKSAPAEQQIIQTQGRQQVLQEPVAQNILGLPKPQQMDALTKKFNELSDAYVAAGQKVDELRQRTKNPFFLLKDLVTGEVGKAAGQRDDLFRQLRALSLLRDELKTGKPIAGTEEQQRRLLLSTAGLPRPAFTSFEDLGRQIQLAGLEPGGDIQAELLRRQLIEFEKLNQQLMPQLIQKVQPPLPAVGGP